MRAMIGSNAFLVKQGLRIDRFDILLIHARKAVRIAVLPIWTLGPCVAQDCVWEGTYTGSLAGVQTPMVMDCREGIHHGRITADGYPYALDLVVTGDTAVGSFSDPEQGGVLSCRARSRGDTLDVVIGEGEVLLGVTPFEWSFRRVGTPDTLVLPVVDQEILDPRLVGVWTHGESYVSGEFSFATQWQLTLAADGTLRQTGRTVGGGAEVSGDSGEGEVATGRWRTSEGMLDLDVGEGFRPHARYVVDGERVMFTLTNGERQVWERD
jgi:hypothetical protein